MCDTKIVRVSFFLNHVQYLPLLITVCLIWCLHEGSFNFETHSEADAATYCRCTTSWRTCQFRKHCYSQFSTMFYSLLFDCQWGAFQLPDIILSTLCVLLGYIQVLSGGIPHPLGGNFFYPTLVGDVSPDSKVRKPYRISLCFIWDQFVPSCYRSSLRSRLQLTLAVSSSFSDMSLKLLWDAMSMIFKQCIVTYFSSALYASVLIW